VVKGLFGGGSKAPAVVGPTQAQVATQAAQEKQIADAEAAQVKRDAAAAASARARGGTGKALLLGDEVGVTDGLQPKLGA
jgi:hypothetical protein